MVKKDKSSKDYLKELDDPKNKSGVNYDLPENPTPLEVAKFEICQNILAYQQDNKLSDKKLATRIGLTVPELEEVLFCQIERFTLDRLMTYANALFSPQQIKITLESQRTSKRSTLHAR